MTHVRRLTALREGRDADALIDDLYPEGVAQHSKVHFTPVAVARCAVALLAPTPEHRVLDLGAGAGKGLTLVPDVDDTVLVLLAHEDPAEGVVLGGLYGVAGPPDAGIDQGNVRRFSLHSRSGHKVTLDDARRSVRIEDATGSFLQLSPEGVQLRASVPLTLEAPGQQIVIRGEQIDFRRG